MKLTDYSNFTDSLPQQYTQRDIKALAGKLKTYVNSTKFLRQGSTVDQYDQATGKRKKVPVSNVKYKTSKKDKGIKSQKLRDLIYSAINSKDPQQLQQAASYKYYSAQLPQTQASLQQQQKHQDLMNALLYGGAGIAGVATGASVPLLSNQYVQKKQRYKDAVACGLIGGTSAMLLARLMKG